MQQRNAAWTKRFELAGAPFVWDLTTGMITFQQGPRQVVADAVFLGSASAGEHTFSWSWANDTIGELHRSRLAPVRAFGIANDLAMLTDAAWPGGRAEALEAAAIAARILEAEGVFVDEHEGLTMCFALFNFRDTMASGG